MRIGLFTDTYPPEINGVANSTYLLKNALEKLGHDVYVITVNGRGGVDSHWEDDGKTLRFKGTELRFLYGYVLTSPFHFKALQEIRNLNLDIIHCQTEFGVGIFAHICAAQLDLPIVCTYHTTYEDYTHYINFINSATIDSAAKKVIARLSRDYGNRANAVIAPSIKTKNMLLGYHIHKDISVIPTGLELEQFDPAGEDHDKTRAIRAQYGFTGNDFLFISVGRLAEEKSVDVIIRWVADANQQGQPCGLLLVGSGPQEEEYRKMVSELGMEKKIIFAGAKPKEEVPDYYRACDAFVSASLSETQGMTFIEALASGLPLFTRYDEVLAKLVIDDKTGWFCQDSDEFIAHFRTYLKKSDAEKKAMQENCVKQVAPLNSEAFAKAVLKVYEKVKMEYFNTWTIDDIQVKDSFVQLYLENDQDEEERLLVTLDDYAGAGLRKGGKITSDTFQRFKEKENGVRAYQGCLVRISIKDRTRKEIYDWLTRETDCDITMINKIVEKLEAQGYINDERYCAEAVSSLKASLYGPDRIVKALMKKGLPADMIHAKLDELPDTTEEEAMAYARKCMNSYKNDSVRKMKYGIETKLIQRGYSVETAKKTVNELSMVKAEGRELDNLKKCALKAQHRYARKYQGTELRNHVFRYCISQGYDTDDIYAVIDELEWENDED
jgi:1,2-diacylglycerol 3-alpha-glucosyltransferase